MATKKNTSLKTTAGKAVSKTTGGGTGKQLAKTNTSAKKTQTPKQKTGAKPPAKTQSVRKKQGYGILDEVLTILVILVCIIVIVSLITTKMGAAGVFINNLLMGLFGFGAYALPVMAICFCTWLLMSEDKEYKYLKGGAAVLFFLSLSVFFHIFASGGETSSEKLLKLWTGLYHNGGPLNGGALGGMIGNMLLKAFGRLGSYFIVIVCMLIAVIMGTGKSFFRGLGSLITYLWGSRSRKHEKIKYKADRIREKEREKEAREERRKKKKGFIDIKVKEETEEERPYIEETVFKPRVRQSTPRKSEPIFDYHRDAVEPVKVTEEAIEQETVTAPEGGEREEFIPIIHAKEAFDEYVEEEGITVSETLDAVLKDITETEETEPLQEAAGAFAAKDCETAKKEETPVTAAKEAVREPKVEKGRAEEMNIKPAPVIEKYHFPPIDLLGKSNARSGGESKTDMLNNAKKLEDTLKSFGVDAKVIQINRGPTVTRYELSPSQGVKVSKIVNLADDIALNLAASGIRIEAPIPGKAAVGIEVPNKETQSVFLRDVIDSEAFKKFPSKLAFALGEDIAGNAVVTDIAKMPHLLIAGATGSGKSVCINTLIVSILYKADPNEVKLLLVDPKVVELSVYNGIPHLLIPVVTDPKKAAGALNWAVREMLMRYQDFAAHNVRDINGYNAMKREKGETDFMPQIVIIIDELADLMMAAPGEVEDSICRLAQMARAAGLHLIIATQRPSVDVITGVIKANIPSRLAFSVTSGIDSRTILDMTGAEKLLGKGDMLFYPVGMSKPQRIQGAFVSDKEVESIVSHIKKDSHLNYDQEMIDKITSAGKDASAGEDSDEFLEQAIELVVAKEKASVSMLQRQFRIGYNRAARLMEDLESRGIVGPEDGSKPRKVLMTPDELEEYKNGGEQQGQES